MWSNRLGAAFRRAWGPCRRIVSLGALVTAALQLGGCAAPRDSGADAGIAAHEATTSQPAPRTLNEAQLAWLEYRERSRRMPVTQVDGPFMTFSRAVPREQVGRYSSYLEQTRSADADTRANGIIGLVAANPRAAVSRLARLLDSEPDPYNRTIIVWCLRYCGDAPAQDVLWKFLAAARDADYGLCLSADGRVATFRAVFPLAAVEAYRALVALRGGEEMYDGKGWEQVMRRLEKNVDLAPLDLDLERLRPAPAPEPPRQEPTSQPRGG
ncbi:MAG: hypothetical protein CHACPFDD_02833 [Phycisphaerae bacterium]|nr:hypothetical protein [Phycisphaerae bacterium]